MKPTLNIEKSSCLAEVAISYKSKIKPSERAKITTSKDSFDAFRAVFSEETIEHHEEFVILLLNRANKVLGWAKISSGGVAGTVVDAKVVFQIALGANASSLILAHNHPSQSLQPSEQDRQLTHKLKEGGKLLDIEILDHIILTSESYFSFADEELM